MDGLTHPIEYRYYTPEMKAIFTEEAKLQRWLTVEAALARAHARLGNIPWEAAEEISRKASTEYVKLERVKEIEKVTRHDVMAMVEALSEVCEGDAGKYVHLGATSYDIVDTALALQLRDALNVTEDRLKELLGVLLDLAERHKETVCVGRTHGQHALPYTYGMKFAIWAWEVRRHLERLREVRRRAVVGKMSGAVGTMAGFGEAGPEIQRLVMEELGLEAEPVSNQVVQRDRHAEVVFLLALVAATLEKIGKEVRNLQRTEIGEVYEPFFRGQVGSSAMPHKRNPWRCERLCGLARVVRSNVMPALEDIALEHERDLTNSSVERVIIPETFILVDFMLSEAIKILRGLEFNYENIRKNLELTGGLIMAERILNELVKKGLARQETHERLREIAVRCWKEKRSFREELLKDPVISSVASPEEVDEWLRPEGYIGSAVRLVEESVKELREFLHSS